MNFVSKAKFISHKLRHTSLTSLLRSASTSSFWGLRKKPSPALSDFDAAHGVDTDGSIRITAMRLSSPNSVYGKSYIPANPELLRTVIQGLRLPGGTYVFIDLGSGKGRQLLVASEFPFKSIVGVEFAAELHQIALANILRYQNPLQKCKSIAPMLGDVVDFRLPPEPLVLFCYNSFEASILEQVLANVERSWRVCQRDILFIYANPMHKGVFDRFDFMPPSQLAISSDESAGRRLAIYRTRQFA